jgi:hypothetical protein
MSVTEIEEELSQMETTGKELERLARTTPEHQDEVLLVVKNLRLSVKYLRASIHRETARKARRRA